MFWSAQRRPRRICRKRRSRTASGSASIAPGSDADIAIVDLGAEGRISRDALHSRSHMTPWHGFETTGRVVHTLVRGKIVVRDGHLVGTPGWGRPVVQDMAAPAPRNTDKTTEAITAYRPD